MTWRRLVAATTLVAVTVAGPATAAAADGARPTDYRSEVLQVDPPLPDGYRLRVVGGDAFLELQVPAGGAAEVPDYGTSPDEPLPAYLRFGPDGIVERNERSNAAAANESRYGSSGRAPSPDEDPDWQPVATGGRYAWHDHRIHWMSPTPPVAVAADGRVDLGGDDGTWTVDLVIDGAPTVARGELILLDSPGAGPWLALSAVVVAGLIGATALLGRAGRRPPHRILAVALGGAGILATVAGWAEWQALPVGAGGRPSAAVIPAVGVAGAVVAAVATGARVRLVALTLAVATLAGWAVVRREVLVRAVLPTSLPFPVDRAATALALGTAVAGAALLAWRPPGARPNR